MELLELLTTTRDIQADRGHCKNVLWAADGRVCMQGALMTADRSRWEFEDAYRAMGFGDCQDMVNWNNALERTLEDVLERFDMAIASLRRAHLYKGIPVPEEERELVVA